AVLSIPLDKRKTAAVLEGAVADATARKPAQSGSRSSSHGHDLRFDKNSSITVESAASDSSSYGGSQGSDSGGKKPVALIAGGIAVLAVAAGVAWYFMHSSSSPTTQAAPTAAGKKASVSVQPVPSDENVAPEPAPVVESALVSGTVDELLEKARQAM